jgi:hypothetical protein
LSRNLIQRDALGTLVVAEEKQTLRAFPQPLGKSKALSTDSPAPAAVNKIKLTADRRLVDLVIF